jgi:hypothetical protein
MRCIVGRFLGLSLLAILCALCVMLSVVAADEPAPEKDAAAAEAPKLDVPLFPLEQLKAGLKGTGYTVIRGTEIKPFNVEIIELIPQGGFDGGPLILARFSGETIDFSNGIAGGYSGSPVYIDGKLLGAVSVAIPFSDTHVGGITPIQSMLKALPDTEELDFSGHTVLPPSSDSGKPLDKEGNEIEDHKEAPPAEQSGDSQVSYFESYGKALAFNENMRRSGRRAYGAVACKTPVFFSGISPQVLDAFGGKLQDALGSSFKLMDRPMGKAADYGLFLNMAGQAPGLLLRPQAEARPPIVAGDALAVSLIQGDIEAYAIGTLTYSDKEGRFLCFGHPLMSTGDTNFPIGKGYITWTFKSIERAFKEGVRLDSAGTLTKDKSAGCGGVLGQQPDLIPVRVKIKDIDLGRVITKKFQVIRHPDFTPILIAMGMSQVAVEALDRQPGGTMKMSYHIEGAGLREPLRRTNFYSDDQNVVLSSAMDLVPVSNLLETNIYREVKVTKVELLIEVTRNRINASIDDAEIINKDLHQPPPAAAAPPATAPPPAAPGGEGQGGQPEAPPGQDGQPAARVSLKYPLQQEKPNPPSPPAPGPGQTTQPTPGVVATPGLAEPVLNLPTFMPGDVIRVKVRLQPYRADVVWREFSVKVPDDFPAGNTMVVVHGGGDLISPSELSGKGRMLFSMGPIIDLQAHDLDSVLEQIVQWPLNNELLVTLVRPYDPTQAQELGQSQSAGPDGEKPEDKVDAKYQMEWVIYNGFMLPVNIVTEEPAQATPPPAETTPPAAAEEQNAGSEAKPASDEGGGGGEENSKNGPHTRLPF